MYALATDLLGEGDHWYADLLVRLWLLVLELRPAEEKPTTSKARETQLADCRAAREMAALVLHDMEVHEPARATIERRYFSGPQLTYARAPEVTAWTRTSAELVRIRLAQWINCAASSSAPVPDKEVRAAVDGRVLEGWTPRRAISVSCCSTRPVTTTGRSRWRRSIRS